MIPMIPYLTAGKNKYFSCKSISSVFLSESPLLLIQKQPSKKANPVTHSLVHVEN